MSASYEFTIWYPELKATALIRRLKTEGTTVENELEKALESLFEQYIPFLRLCLKQMLGKQKRMLNEKRKRSALQPFKLSLMASSFAGS